MNTKTNKIPLCTMSWWISLVRLLKRVPLLLVSLFCYTVFILLIFRQAGTKNKQNQKVLLSRPSMYTEQSYIPTRIIEKLKTKIVTKIVYRTQPTQPTGNINHHTTQDYIQLTDVDVAMGNITCDDDKECAPVRLHTASQAKFLCDNYINKCKGFVFMSSRQVYFKSDIKGKLIPHPGRVLFVKRAHAQGFEKLIEIKPTETKEKKSKQPEAKQTQPRLTEERPTGTKPSEANISQSFCAVEVDEKTVSDFSGCKLATFNPFNKNIMRFVKKPEPLKCKGQQNTRYRNGFIEIIPSSSKGLDRLSKAWYYPITRIQGKDWGYQLGKSVPLDLTTKNPVHDEFLRVETKTEDNKTHVEFHAAVVPKPDVTARLRTDTGLPLSVMMIGFDSLSRAHFERVFPEAYKFLKNDLKSVIMDGYTIVGDGTTPALTAFMTGKFEAELPEARRGFEESTFVDRWPWIFKEYKSAGYANMFSEDCPAYAAFNYRLHGFNNTPADHFSRYFWESAQMTQPFCIHDKPQHAIHLDYIETFFQAYPKTPKLGIAFFTDISHNNLNTIQLCVNDFTEFVKNLKQENHLNDTLLVIFSDHGFRYGDSRATFQGHLEERLPLLSLSFPSWFQKTHPEIIVNLRHNADVVTSPFDLHATLRHILTYPDLPKTTNQTRGTSLLQKIPKSRDCQTAGVAEHYCPCLNVKTADTKHKHIRLGSEAVVLHINNMLSADNRSAALCHQLKVKNILSGLQQMSNTKFQQFLGSADIHGRVPKFSKGKIAFKECNYQIQIQTSPGDGLFEAPIQFKDGEFTVTGDISRINMYGEQPRCILDTRPDLRKYCLCKDYKITRTPSTKN